MRAVGINGYGKYVCFKCGKPAVFWVHLGDFVTGYRLIETVCEDCLESVLSECVYESERWKHNLRYWLISGAKVNDKVNELIEKEWKRVGWDYRPYLPSKS